MNLETLAAFAGLVVIALIYGGITLLKMFNEMGREEKIVLPLDEKSVRHDISSEHGNVTHLTTGNGSKKLTLIEHHSFSWGHTTVVLHLKDGLIQKAEFNSSLPFKPLRRKIFTQDEIVQ